MNALISSCVNNSKKITNFGLNFYSAFLFFIPALIAYKKNDMHVFVGSTSVAISGILYHGTCKQWLRIIDQIILSFCIVYFMITRASYTTNYACTVFCVISIIIIYSFFSSSKCGDIWHSLIHVISCIGIILITDRIVIDVPDKNKLIV